MPVVKVTVVKNNLPPVIKIGNRVFKVKK